MTLCVLPPSRLFALRTIGCWLAFAIAGGASASGPTTTERRGWVKKTVNGAQIQNPGERECVAPLPPDAIAAHRWVVVMIPKGRLQRFRTVMLPEGANFAPGDRVVVDVANCSVPLRHLQ